MKGGDSGLAHGTIGSPQTSLDQGEYAERARENERRLEAELDDPLVDDALVAELVRSGTKFAREDMIFITRDKTGQVIWLEKGNALVGLEHIVSRGHDRELAKTFGVNPKDINRLLRDIIKHGEVISCALKKINGRDGYEKKYDYGGKHIVLAAVGTNGFLVTAYPK